MDKPPIQKKSIKSPNQRDRIEDNIIILDGEGIFPKKLLIIELGQKREYELRKTSLGNYQLLK